MTSIIKVDQIQNAAGGTPTAGDLGLNTTGSVLQVVQYFDKGSQLASKSNLLTSTSSTLADVMSKSITTQQANSKILMQLHTVAYNSGAELRGKALVLRDSTEIDADRYAFYTNAASNMVNYISTVLDTPNVAAGTTLIYKLQVANMGSGTLNVGYGDGSGGANSNITLIEIAG